MFPARGVLFPFTSKENIMLDRAFLKSYLTWLETASIEELEARHKKAVIDTKRLQDPDVRRAARFLLRLLEAEILARKN